MVLDSSGLPWSDPDAYGCEESCWKPRCNQGREAPLARQPPGTGLEYWLTSFDCIAAIYRKSDVDQLSEYEDSSG